MDAETQAIKEQLEKLQWEFEDWRGRTQAELLNQAQFLTDYKRRIEALEKIEGERVRF